MKKTCTKCETEKSLEEFYKHSGHRDRHSSQCIPCVKARVKKWKANPLKQETLREQRRRYRKGEKGKVSQKKGRRKYHFKSRYGMTLEERDQMIADQNGLCAICSRELDLEDSKKTCVDHSHETEEVRGILCRGCNRGLGFFEDNPEILDKAAEYLREKCPENAL